MDGPQLLQRIPVICDLAHISSFPVVYGSYGSDILVIDYFPETTGQYPLPYMGLVAPLAWVCPIAQGCSIQGYESLEANGGCRVAVLL